MGPGVYNENLVAVCRRGHAAERRRTGNVAIAEGSKNSLSEIRQPTATATACPGVFGRVVKPSDDEEDREVNGSVWRRSPSSPPPLAAAGRTLRRPRNASRPSARILYGFTTDRKVFFCFGGRFYDVRAPPAVCGLIPPASRTRVRSS